LQLVLVTCSCPMGQVKKKVNVEACGKHLLAMECSVLSFFRAECKVSYTGSAQC
jgi:hypothetical protein